MSYQQALEDIKLGYYEAAIAKLDPLLHADPSQAKLWYAKALALVNLQRFGEAVTSAQLSVQLNPTFAPGYQLLGNACTQLEDKRGAISAYKQAAHCYLDQGDKKQAQTCLDKLKALGPQFIPNEQKSFQESQEFFQKISVGAESGDHEAALNNLNWLLNFDPKNAEALAKRGLVQAKRRNYSAALADINLALQLCPNDLNLRLQRGKIRLWLNDAEGAMADFSALLETEWGDTSEIYCLRSQAYQQLNDLDSAFQDLANALYINPENSECYRVRGDIYRGLKDWEEAISNYRRAISLSLEQGNQFNYKKLQAKIAEIERKIEREKQEASRIIRVPIKSRHGGTPIIEVLFNDCVTCDMVLDTGAGIVCVPEEIARSLNIVFIGNQPLRVADGSVTNAPIGYVRSVAIQQAKAENLEVAILPRYSTGLLGQNYLWQYDVRILQTEVELYLR